MDLQLITIACLAGPQVVFTSNNDSNIFVMIVMQWLSLTGSAVNNDQLLLTTSLLFDCVMNEAMQMLSVYIMKKERDHNNI